MTVRSLRAPQHGGILVNLIVLIALAVLCLVLYLARHPLLRFAAEAWVVDQPAAHADAILVLGDDNFFADRAAHAAELYRHGAAPLVVASGRRLRPNAGIAELMEHDLIERGVPKEKIIPCVHDADNTREEAVALARLAADRRWKSVIVVTSNYHTRRARYIFLRVFPPGIAVTLASARDGEFDPEKWWETRISVKLFAREALAMIVAMLELRGRNAAHLSPDVGAFFCPSLQSAHSMDRKGTSRWEKACLYLYFA